MLCNNTPICSEMNVNLLLYEVSKFMNYLICVVLHTKIYFSIMTFSWTVII